MKIEVEKFSLGNDWGYMADLLFYGKACADGNAKIIEAKFRKEETNGTKCKTQKTKD